MSEPLTDARKREIDSLPTSWPASPTGWVLAEEAGYRGPVPAMPKAERDEYRSLFDVGCYGTPTDADRARYQQLRAKVQYRAEREIDE